MLLQQIDNWEINLKKKSVIPAQKKKILGWGESFKFKQWFPPPI